MEVIYDNQSEKRQVGEQDGFMPATERGPGSNKEHD